MEFESWTSPWDIVIRCQFNINYLLELLVFRNQSIELILLFIIMNFHNIIWFIHKRSTNENEIFETNIIHRETFLNVEDMLDSLDSSGVSVLVVEHVHTLLVIENIDLWFINTIWTDIVNWDWRLVEDGVVKFVNVAYLSLATVLHHRESSELGEIDVLSSRGGFFISSGG